MMRNVLFIQLLCLFVISSCGTTQRPSNISRYEAKDCEGVMFHIDKKYNQKCLNKINQNKVKKEDSAEYSIQYKTGINNDFINVDISLLRNGVLLKSSSDIGDIGKIELHIPELNFKEGKNYNSNTNSAFWDWSPQNNPIIRNKYNAYIVTSIIPNDYKVQVHKLAMQGRKNRHIIDREKLKEQIKNISKKIKVHFKLKTSEWNKYFKLKNTKESQLKRNNKIAQAKLDIAYKKFSKQGCVAGDVIIKKKLSLMEYEIGLGLIVGGGHKAAILKTAVTYTRTGSLGMLALENKGKRKIKLINGFGRALTYGHLL